MQPDQKAGLTYQVLLNVNSKAEEWAGRKLPPQGGDERGTAGLEEMLDFLAGVIQSTLTNQMEKCGDGNEQWEDVAVPVLVSLGLD